MTRYQRVLGIDPGLRAMGIAVLGPRGELRHVGVLTVPRDLPLTRRLRRLGKDLEAVLALFHPRLVVIEKTWPNKDPSLALLHRAAQLAARHVRGRRVRLVTVPSTTVRRDLLGDGWASKHETARALAARYPELRLYLRRTRAFRGDPFANLFDAVAVALWAQKTMRKR